MKSITVDDVMRELPCEDYPHERVVELWGGREAITPREGAEFAIPAKDRYWAMVYCVLNPMQNRMLAVRIARHLHSLRSDVSKENIEALDVAERFANGRASKSELLKAHFASDTESWAATRRCAYQAAIDVVWDSEIDWEIALQWALEMAEESKA